MPARLKRIPGDIAKLLAEGGGLLTMSSARRAGITPRRLQRIADAELLVRLAHGVYASVQHIDLADPWSAFALRSRAAVMAAGPGSYAAGWSAVALLGLPTISRPPDQPQVIRPHQIGTAVDSTHTEPSAPSAHRRIYLPSDHRRQINGIGVVATHRTVVDISRTSPRADALVLADAALRAGVGRDKLFDVIASQRHWPGVSEANWVAEHADPYAESGLESLGRLTFIEFDLPIPLSNVWVDVGNRHYRPDHLLDDYWQVFEGDGSQKYDNRLNAGSIVAAQREREWQLRSVGLEINRYGWAEARHDRPRLAERFRSVIANRPVRDYRCPWYRRP